MSTVDKRPRTFSELAARIYPDLPTSEADRREPVKPKPDPWQELKQHMDEQSRRRTK
jgi:hypothetical protein